MGVGLVGGPVGAMVGGIVGAVVGGVTGAIIGENVASSALDSLLGGGSCEQRATLRKAYRQLGLEQGASNSDVRSRYLRLSRDNHPDKGGNKKELPRSTLHTRS